MAMVSLGCSFSIFSTQPESGLEYQKTHSVGEKSQILLPMKLMNWMNCAKLIKWFKRKPLLFAHLPLCLKINKNVSFEFFQKHAKLAIFGIFNELLSTLEYKQDSQY